MTIQDQLKDRIFEFSNTIVGILTTYAMPWDVKKEKMDIEYHKLEQWILHNVNVRRLEVKHMDELSEDDALERKYEEERERFNHN